MTRHRDLEADLHPSVITARHLRATADTWPDLLAALEPGSVDDQSGVRSTGEAPVPLDVHISDVVAEVAQWAYFWARVLADETDWQPPDAGVDTRFTYREGERERPFDTATFGRGGLVRYVAGRRRRHKPIDTPTLLRALALRTGHFVMHPDAQLAYAFVEECAETKRRVQAAAWPNGAKRIPLHFACLQCSGEYTALLLPEQTWTVIPNLECNRDRSHVITPAEWQRLERKKPANPDAARRFLASLRGVA